MKIARTSFIFLSVALFISGCDSKKPEGAAPPPASTGSGTTTSPAAKNSAPATTGAAQKSYPAPTDFNLVPLAVGQWIRLQVTIEGQAPTQTFIRIVGKEGNAFWCEVEQGAPTGTTVMQFLMDEASRDDFKPNSIKKLKLKTPNGVQELTGAALSASSALTDKYIHLIGKPKLDKAERGDVTVSAGEFKGCYLHPYDQQILGVSMKIKSWNHPAVPINGFVRSEGTANGAKTTTELMEMHLDGAKSAMP